MAKRIWTNDAQLDCLSTLALALVVLEEVGQLAAAALPCSGCCHAAPGFGQRQAVGGTAAGGGTGAPESRGDGSDRRRRPT